MILLCAAAITTPAAAQEKAEAYTVLTLDPQRLMTEGFYDAGTDGGEATDTLGSTTQGIWGGGGQNCSGDGSYCRSYTGGAVDNCSNCDSSCPDSQHNDVVSWWTNDDGWYSSYNSYVVSGGTMCLSAGFTYEAAFYVCTSDHYGVVCRDCGGCFTVSDYFPG